MGNNGVNMWVTQGSGIRNMCALQTPPSQLQIQLETFRSRRFHIVRGGVVYDHSSMQSIAETTWVILICR